MDEEERFYCPGSNCPKNYTKLSSMERHGKVCAIYAADCGKNPQKYECPFEGCNKAYTRPDVLVRHGAECEFYQKALSGLLQSYNQCECGRRKMSTSEQCSKCNEYNECGCGGVKRVTSYTCADCRKPIDAEEIKVKKTKASYQGDYSLKEHLYDTCGCGKRKLVKSEKCSVCNSFNLCECGNKKRKTSRVCSECPSTRKPRTKATIVISKKEKVVLKEKIILKEEIPIDLKQQGWTVSLTAGPTITWTPGWIVSQPPTISRNLRKMAVDVGAWDAIKGDSGLAFEFVVRYLATKNLGSRAELVMTL